MALSENLKHLIQSTISTPEFWMANYYMRSMKKAPHSGVFHIGYPNMFLKYWPVSAYDFFTPNAEIPAPLIGIAPKIHEMIYGSSIDTDELTHYCIGIDSDDCDSSHYGSRMYIANCGEIITSSGRRDMERHMIIASDAISGKIRYSENFDINEERLILLFVLTLMKAFLTGFTI